MGQERQMSWQRVFENPRGSRRIGTFGDVNPVDYGGGIIYRNEYGTRVEYTYGLDQSDSPDRMSVYSVFVPDDVFADNSWVKVDQIAATIGADPAELLAAGRSKKLMDRVYALEAIASTWGWQSLDDDPQIMTEKELRRRWRSY
jgi:hypothetical protein